MKPAIIIAISILAIGISITSISAQSQTEIPAWVKNNAIWWGENKISDSEFISALQYLITNGHLKVENSSKDITELENKIKKVETENKRLQTDNKRLQTTVDNFNSIPVVEEIDPYQLSLQELKEQAVPWNYDDILRNEEYYKGKIIFLTGKISTVIEKEEYGDWVLLDVYTGHGTYSDLWLEDEMYIWYGGSRLLREDIIEAYIVVDGLHKVESMLEGSYTYYPVGRAMHVTCTTC